MKNRQIIFMDIVIAFLSVCLLFATWQLFNLPPAPELPLTQETAEKIGGKILRNSFPILFKQEFEGQKLDMEIKVEDSGDAWEVFNYHKPQFIETKDGRKIRPGYATVSVVLEKATGHVIFVGF